MLWRGVEAATGYAASIRLPDRGIDIVAIPGSTDAILGAALAESGRPTRREQGLDAAELARGLRQAAGPFEAEPAARGKAIELAAMPALPTDL
jgi:hypothetical protein